ncbi:hypothetical protein KJK34_00535 [Flavobacterium sp. D11R37]|uniref:hypothetical protein n=1 Tax=Flavobacterium coralii TaxID=2838017 RepID=UPI001CA6B4E3|nr:hypothetical protein [Flavobacterium coralii]MBY8961230.1 hypothetical protein [Flavobacterium coralii]
MKHFFKYHNGYINIDDENLYLTTTGNWSETKDIIEKSTVSKRDNFSRIANKQNFLVAIGIILTGFFFYNNAFKSIILPVLIIGAGLFLLFNYTRRDFGLQYKIPLSKIDSIILIDQNDIKIIFRNLNNEPDTETLKGVNNKGIEYLTKLLGEEKGTIQNKL